MSCSYGSWNVIGVIWRYRNVAEVVNQETLIMDVFSILKSEHIRMLWRALKVKGHSGRAAGDIPARLKIMAI